MNYLAHAYLSKDEVGVEITKTYIENLPQDVDPCGENGEFHTYCFEGPIFKIPINIEVKEKLYKDLDLKFQMPDKNQKITKGFWYANIELKRD